MRLALILAGAAIAAALVPLPSTAVERWYSQGVYPVIQHAVTRGSSTVSFALLDIAAILAVVGWLGFVARRWRTRGLAAGARAALTAFLVAASLVYLSFLGLWGLNYRRVPLETKVAYDESRITPEATIRFGELAVERANVLASARPAGSDQALEYSFDEVVQRLGATSHPLVAAPKRSVLTWYFRRAGIDGMTNPFFLEIIVNTDVLPVERPFVLAHEWAHLAGYAYESEANFVAWLTCVRADAGAQYSGWLAAYRHAAAALPRPDRRNLQQRLTPAVIGDLQAIAARLERANPAVRDAARSVYDSYLRANRVDEGIASYDAVLRLMLGTTFESGWAPRLRGSADSQPMR